MFKLAKKLTKKDLFYFLISILFIVLQVWLDLKIPVYIMSVMNDMQEKVIIH